MESVWEWVGWGGVVVVVVVTWAVSACARVVEWVWLRPKRLERCLREQGLKGTPYRLLYGDLKEGMELMKEATAKPIAVTDDIVPRVTPFLNQTMNRYGKMSFSWFGPYPRVSIMDPELVREIFSKSGDFEKPHRNPLGKLFVRGLVTYEGKKWAQHRRILNPAFHLEKLKRMLPAFSTSCHGMVLRWEKLVGAEKSVELDVWPELQNLTGDVISRTVFGSSYEEGNRIFQLQTEQIKLLILQVARSLYIPGYRFLPTKTNKRMKHIYREVRMILRRIIEKREKAMEIGEATNDDLLGLLLESNLKQSQEHTSSYTRMSIDDVIEECKLFYFAGQETTASLLTFTMIVLSMHQNWQARAREEVMQFFGKNNPDYDDLSRLKIVTMILYEVLRLYPPIAFLGGCTYKEIKIGGFTLPAGVDITLPLMSIHHDKEIWGEDAKEFKPERFAEGVSKASKIQAAFFPFGGGPRFCIGQSFGMMEAKIAMAMILQHFSFHLSPSYVHACPLHYSNTSTSTWCSYHTAEIVKFLFPQFTINYYCWCGFQLLFPPKTKVFSCFENNVLFRTLEKL